MRAFEFLTFLGAAIGLFCLVASFAVPGAPQQAALAAIACAFVILPYCVASTLHRRDRRD